MVGWDTELEFGSSEWTQMDSLDPNGFSLRLVALLLVSIIIIVDLFKNTTFLSGSDLEQIGILVNLTFGIIL